MPEIYRCTGVKWPLQDLLKSKKDVCVHPFVVDTFATAIRVWQWHRNTQRLFSVKYLIGEAKIV